MTPTSCRRAPATLQRPGCPRPARAQTVPARLRSLRACPPPRSPRTLRQGGLAGHSSRSRTGIRRWCGTRPRAADRTAAARWRRTRTRAPPEGRRPPTGFRRSRRSGWRVQAGRPRRPGSAIAFARFRARTPRPTRSRRPPDRARPIRKHSGPPRPGPSVRRGRSCRVRAGARAAVGAARRQWTRRTEPDGRRW